MTVVIQRLPRTKLGIKDRDFVVNHDQAVCLFPTPAEVLVRFKFEDDEVHMRTECQAIKPSAWHLVPPMGLKVLGLSLQVWAIDIKAKTASITFAATQEAQIWQLDSIKMA